MDQDKKKRLVDRIAKLFRLGDANRNDSESEVLLAATKARQLMAEHDISRADLSLLGNSAEADTILYHIIGGGILPQQRKLTDSDGLQPNRNFVLWPYTQWSDRRLRLGEEFVAVKAGAPREGLKVGCFNPHGWMGYLFDDVFFVKRFGVRSDEIYPDFGCNSEVFSNHRVVELQSLGPLTHLAPKKSIVHTETWEVYRKRKSRRISLGKEAFGNA